MNTDDLTTTDTSVLARDTLTCEDLFEDLAAQNAEQARRPAGRLSDRDLLEHHAVIAQRTAASLDLIARQYLSGREQARWRRLARQIDPAGLTRPSSRVQQGFMRHLSTGELAHKAAANVEDLIALTEALADRLATPGRQRILRGQIHALRPIAACLEQTASTADGEHQQARRR